jgi:hypothetical protein
MKCPACRPIVPKRSVPARIIEPCDIADFLAGRSNGAPLLHSFFDCVLEEPVPSGLTR